MDEVTDDSISRRPVVAMARAVIRAEIGGIEPIVHNDSRYRVTDVQLRVEGLNADNHEVGQRVVWALGDIAPSGETSVVAERIPGAVNYRITVVSFDLVSVEAP